MTAQDDWVASNLDILQKMQLSGMDVEEQLAWAAKIDDVQDRYDKARAVERDEKASEAERKRAKEVADGIAKAAPAITKSVISAVKAFQNGDAVNCAADIMDICASLAPLISTFLNATGPEGALIGALVSVIGQILRCFGPKQESDVAKLEKFIAELQAQTNLEKMKAVHDSALVYARTLLRQSADLQALLAQPLKTHEDYQKFFVAITESSIIIGDGTPHGSIGEFANWQVLEYLEDPANQDVSLWPSVLGVCCKTYSDIVTTTMAVTAMVHNDDLIARLQEVAPGKSSLPENERDRLEVSLLKLMAYANVRRKEYASCNERMLKALKVVAEPARRWGLYGSIATNYALKFATGPKKVRNGDWNDVSDRNYYHQLAMLPDSATTIRPGQSAAQFNFKPSYHLLVLKSSSNRYPGSNHWVDHLWVRADTGDVDKYHDVLNNFNPAFTDVWPAGESDSGQLEVFAGTAEGTGAPGSVMSWTLDPKDNFNSASLDRVNWWPQTKHAVGSIRAVKLPMALPGDPDETAIAPTGGPLMIYASMRESTEIYVNTGNRDHYIPGPDSWGPCTGITVDENYLWLYQPNGFSVVSHASVLNYLHGIRPAPRWMNYPSLGPALLGENLGRGDKSRFMYNGRNVDTKPALLGLISLSPCTDNTLLAAVVHRQIDPIAPFFFRMTDTWTIQTTNYEIDPGKGEVRVGSWTKIPGEALHVQKLPMPGWNLLTSLQARLIEPSKLPRAEGSIANRMELARVG